MFFYRPDKAFVLTRAASGAFFFLLIFSPVAFGSVEQWSLTIMETVAVFAFLLAVSGRLKERDPVFFAAPGMVPLMLLLSYIAFQLVPLPPLFLKHISPATYELYERTVGSTGTSLWMPLSVDRKATVMEFLRFSAYASFYLLTVQLLTKGTFLKKTVNVVILLASLLAFQGVLQYFLSNGRVLWLRGHPGGGHPFGTYVNRNHFAGLMEMVLPVALSAFLVYKPAASRGPLRGRLAGLFERHETNTFVLLGGAILLISSAVFLSASRGGILGMCIGMALFSVLYFNRTRDSRGILLLLIISALLALSVTWFGWGMVLDRFASLMDEKSGRFVQWKDSLHIIRDFPLTGAGFGCFEDIYKGYSSQYWYAIVDHAQNDYLELLCEGGMIGFLLMGCFVLAVIYRSWRMFLKRRSGAAALLYIGSISGMAGILIHSMTDFNLHIGANGLYFFFLAGLAVSSAGTRLQSETQDTLLPSRNCLHLRGMSLLLCVLLLAGLAVNSGILAGEGYFLSFRKNQAVSQDGGGPARAEDLLSHASFFDPLEAEYWYRRAITEEALRDRSAAVHYSKAVQASPANGEYLQGYGLYLARAGQDESAARLLGAATRQDICNPERYRVYAAWLLARHKKEEAFREIRKALSLRPQETREYIALMVLNGADNKEIARTLPKEPGVNMMFADYLSATGDSEMASQYYHSLLDSQEDPGRLQPGFFYSAHAFYVKQDMEEDALRIMHKAVLLFPDRTDMRLLYAGLLEKRGQTEQSVVEYRKVLVFDPNNASAKERLKHLDGV